MRELIATEILASVEENNSTVRKEFRIRDDNSENPLFRDLNIQARGAAFSLAIETIRRLNVLDRIVNLAFLENKYFSLNSENRNIPVNSIKGLSLFERATFRLATYRMLFEKHPAPLVTNTALDCLKEKLVIKKVESANNLLKTIENIDLDSIYEQAADEAEKIGLETFHRTWFARHMISELGNDDARAFLSSCNDNPPVYFRINTRKNVEEIKQKLINEGVVFHRDTDLDDLQVLDSVTTPLPRLKGFKSGDFYIQAKSSSLVAHVLNPKRGERILDACAAPGGKTLHLAARSKYGAKIVATDINKTRLVEMRRNLNKYDVTNIETKRHDFREPLHRETLFDKVLVDAPCTGSGTFQSRPEGKWKMKKRLVQFYAKLQRKILENSSSLVKEGGQLLYATCSVFRTENEDVIDWFLHQFPEFVPIEQEIIIGKRTDHKGQRLFPHIHQTEGFCLFLLEKIKS
ncbi:MAG: SAM-dependent methyltransferase [Candidatus Hodarchaeales archaeon]|jgi:16S rRNA (cytosine967-C5)-methyltransferase